MSANATELSRRVKDRLGETVSVVTTCNEEKWQAVSGSERWPISILALHIADVTENIHRMISDQLSDPTNRTVLTVDQLDEINATRARERANVTPSEVIALLTKNGAKLEGVIGGLGDVELDRVAGTIAGGELTNAQLIESAVIDHFGEHLRSMRETIAR